MLYYMEAETIPLLDEFWSNHAAFGHQEQIYP